MKKALESYRRPPCNIYSLNTVLRHTLKDNWLQEYGPIAYDSLEATKRVVTYLKRSGHIKDSRLQFTVKQQVDTRWNTIKVMLKSVFIQHEQIAEVLREFGKIYLLENWNYEAVDKLIQFLEVFQEATKAMEADSGPTLQLVATMGVPATQTLY